MAPRTAGSCVLFGEKGFKYSSMQRPWFFVTQEKISADGRDTYVVQRGDTLAGVALRLGVKQSELKRANHMYGSRTLVAGQVS